VRMVQPGSFSWSTAAAEIFSAMTIFKGELFLLNQLDYGVWPDKTLTRK